MILMKQLKNLMLITIKKSKQIYPRYLQIVIQNIKYKIFHKTLITDMKKWKEIFEEANQG